VKKIPEKCSVTVTREGKPFPISDEAMSFWSTSLEPSVKIEGKPLVFVGYGTVAAEHAWDDFKDVDVKGKILLVMNDDPQVTENGQELFKGEARTYYGRWTYKFEEALRHGAAGAFIIHTDETAGYPYSVVAHHGVEESNTLDQEGAGYPLGLLGWFDQATSKKLAEAMGTTLEDLFKKAQSRDFRPIETGFTVDAVLEKEIRKLETTNIWGALRGAAAPKSDEWIVVTAHYDHLGLVHDPRDGDKVYNGAWDNASGVSCLLELARQLKAAGPLPRSILFLATTAEEKGTLGSRWFVGNPPVPAKQLIANFNVDMVQIFGETSDIAAIGLEMSSLGDTLKEVAAGVEVTVDGKKQPLVVTGDTMPREGSFYRSDQVHFAKAGIPALFINPGSKHLVKPKVDVEAYAESHYHQPVDQIDEAWNLTGAVRDLDVLREVLTRVAKAEDIPRWAKGNEFEKAFEERRK
jgi:Zn-dependent M28 family amino/carboxypeptidase